MKEKKVFSIGEIAKMIDVEIHTIRFWTDEFSEYIQYELGKGDRRYYEASALSVFSKIRELIHKDGIRIKVIKEKKLLLQPSQSSKTERLSEARKILESILQNLSRN